MKTNNTNQPAFEQLSNQQKLFVKEYITDLNASRAAKEAGYSKPAVAGCKLLKNKKVQAAIDDVLRPQMQQAELTAENVLRQLHSFLFRDIADYIDTEGYLVCSPAKLPEHARQAIDSWELFRDYNEDGSVKRDRWKIKCVSKSTALELAMKYLKLLGPDIKVEQNNLTVENFWADFYSRAAGPVQPPIDAKIKELLQDGSSNTIQAQAMEQRHISGSKPGNNGSTPSNGSSGSSLP